MEGEDERQGFGEPGAELDVENKSMVPVGHGGCSWEESRSLRRQERTGC